jgi:hypothetical protein
MAMYVKGQMVKKSESKPIRGEERAFCIILSSKIEQGKCQFSLFKLVVAWIPLKNLRLLFWRSTSSLTCVQKAGACGR